MKTRVGYPIGWAKVATVRRAYESIPGQALGRALSLAFAAAAGAGLAIAILTAFGLLASVSGARASSDDSVARVYREASPGVLSIVDQGQPGTQSPNYALGSGFVVDIDGYVLTDHHVIEGVSEVGIVLADGSAYPADIIGVDVVHDLAVLRAEVPREKLHPLRLGESSALHVGDPVIAIGSPFGLQQTLTSGHVSFVGRRIELPSKAVKVVIEDAIQTDAALNPGNSGGPLLDGSGEVVGVNTFAMVKGTGDGQYGSIGVGFAIPSTTIGLLLPQMIEGGLRAKPWLGITAIDSRAQGAGGADGATLGQALPSEPEDPKGARLVLVLPGSPAGAAHLRGSQYASHRTGAPPDESSDVITAIDGREISSVGDLASYMARSSMHVGDVVRLQVLRDGRLLEVSVRLRARNDRQAEQAGII